MTKLINKERPVLLVFEQYNKYKFRTRRGEPLHPFCEHINYALSRMNKKERDLLINEYLSDNDPNWWKDQFSKSTFYRQKHIAIDSFLNCVRTG